MSEKICPNCNYKCDLKDEFCQECGTPLDLSKYIESKELEKKLTDKIKSFLGNRRIDEINNEIDKFIRLSYDLKDYYSDLSKLSALKFDKTKFKEKYSKALKIDDFNYLDEINKDEDLNKKVLLLKSIKTFINNFDNELEKFKKLLDEIEIKTKDLDNFNNDLDELLNSDKELNVFNKNDLIASYKLTYDFFDRDKVKNLDINSHNKIQEFLSSYESIDGLFEKHNEELKIKKHDEQINGYANDADNFVEDINKLINSEDFIPSTVVSEIKEEFEEAYNFLKNEDIPSSNLSSLSKSNVSKFLNDYDNLEEIIDKFNEELSIKILENKLNSNISTLNQFNEDLNNLIDSNFYITFKQKDDLIEKYQDLFDLVTEASEKIELSEEFDKFLNDYPLIDLTIKSRNEKYVENELIEHKDFFDNIDGKSLDINQRLAVVKNELNSQIIAGAGCGKTLTVNAKVRYLIEKKGINPNEILCLSFSNLSVSDLKEKLPSGVEIATFHKLGGAILRANDKPARPDTDAMDNYIKEYFRDHIINNEKLCEDIFEFYSYYLYSSINEDQATSLGEVYDIEESKDFRTFRELYGGDKEKITYDNKRVKSLEELIIANYLFAHQIDYEYEKIFKCKNKYYGTQKEFVFNLVFDDFEDVTDCPELSNELLNDIYELCDIKEEIILTNYNPDFYLKENNIYLEHFGVNRNCEALWLDKEDSDKYRQGIYWKRELHKNYGSTLLETFSYYMGEDRLLTRLEDKLKKAGVEIKEIDYEYLFSKIVERDTVNRYVNFINLITTFIQLFKGNDYTIDKFDEFKKENESNEDEFDKKRTNLFLNIVEDIYISYENHLKAISKIDFNDMINNATREVENGNLHRHFKYILVDEYQDTSYTRYNLVKAIQDKTGAKVCVVGDDWQSIYRFTGCDVALFSKFEDYFENPDKLKIETTYRNSQELIDISGRFIKKNPNQIQKSLNSKKDSSSKPVKIIYYNNSSKEDKIKKMEFLVEKISKESNDIMILGRNNFDIKDFVEAGLFKRKHKDDPNLIYEKNEDLNIKFISVHKSKGLEEDNVILINLENKTAGFPNQMIDDPLMNFVINDSDQYPHGEERRLFYVALTRTKNNAYLLVPETDKSEFVLELEENIDDLDILYPINLEESYDDIDDFMEDKNVYSVKTKLKCPVCKTGDVILKIIKKKDGTNIIKFFECSHRRCDWEGGFYNSDLEFLDEIDICPECGGVIQVINGKYGPFNTCSNKCKVPKLSGEKLERVNKIIRQMESDIEFETHKSKLQCPKCGEGKVTLRIHPDNKQKRFVCSNESCDWDGGKTTIDLFDLEKIKICPDCDGILTLKNGKRGKFYGCSNFPKCKYTISENGDVSKPVKGIKTKLKCPSCKNGDVLLKGKKFVCSSCNWDGGTFSGDADKLDTIEYCKNPECDGVTYMRSGRYGDFRTCSNYFKTKCDGGRNLKKSSKGTTSRKQNENIIKTKLKCPVCNKGEVILDNSKFKCTSCDWDGGSFNGNSKKLDSIEYCSNPNCTGITYLKEGKYGEFRSCSNYFKTKCDGGRNLKKSSKSSYSKKEKSPSKWKRIDTELHCPLCSSQVFLLKNTETGKGFFKCDNDNCDWNGGSFNKSEDLLNTLSYCPEPGCDGLTYEVDGKYGPFRVCTNFAKTNCKAGRR